MLEFVLFPFFQIWYAQQHAKKKDFAHKCYVYAFFSLRLCIKAVKPFSDCKYRDATFWDFPFKSRNISHYYMHLCCKASILYELYFLLGFFFPSCCSIFLDYACLIIVHVANRKLISTTYPLRIRFQSPFVFSIHYLTLLHLGTPIHAVEDRKRAYFAPELFFILWKLHFFPPLFAVKRKT